MGQAGPRKQDQLDQGGDGGGGVLLFPATPCVALCLLSKALTANEAPSSASEREKIKVSVPTRGMDLVGFPKAMGKKDWPGLQKAVLEVAAPGPGE